MPRVLLAILAVLALAPATNAATPDPCAFSAWAGVPVDYTLRSATGLERAYYFGGDNHTIASNGEVERYVDPSYCAVVDPVRPRPGGGFIIAARVPTAAERAACRMKPGERYLSGLVTTQGIWSFTYGYLEAELQMPAAASAWPAFWLLPATFTKANAGEDPEIDVVEEWEGPLLLTSQGRTIIDDRTGYPISTLHHAGDTYSSGQHAKVGNGTWHDYGVVWTPTDITFCVDGARTYTVHAAVTDPHYLVLNLAFDGRPYGPTTPPAFPDPMAFGVDWVRHRPLTPAKAARLAQ